MAQTFKISNASLKDFNDTLKKYAQLSKKDGAKIVNTKAYYIARAACRATPRPEPTKIGKELSEMIYSFKTTKKGASKSLKTRNTFGAQGQAIPTPIAALLINWKRGKSGLKGLTGLAMKKAINSLIASRNRARAYMAAGWIPAIQALQKLAEKPNRAAPNDAEARKIKKPKGWAEVATEGKTVAKAIIGNAAAAKQSTTKDPLGKFGMAALEKAFNHETTSMKSYIEEKLKKSAQSCGIKTR